MDTPREYLTRREGAEYLRVSLRTFDALISRGLIPRFRVSKARIVFRRKDLDAYVENNKVEDGDTASVAVVASEILGK